MEKNLDTKLENTTEVANTVENQQTKFIDTMLGKAINTALDVGIRAALPDFIEEQVINIKNNIFEHGIKEGISKTIGDAINLGKSATGLIKGQFENVEQMQNVIKSGGIIDGISELWDNAIKKAKENGTLKSKTATTINSVKDTILDVIESNINNAFKLQSSNEAKLQEEIKNWKEAYGNKDFEKMEEEYKKIEEILKNTVPMEETTKKAREIENIQELLKNNGQNFNLSKEQLELVKEL